LSQCRWANRPPGNPHDESNVCSGWKADISTVGTVGLTPLIRQPYPKLVIRLFLAVLCSFGLALSPVLANGAIAAPNSVPGCTMNGHMPAKPADHSKMDCCTPACQASAAALQPERTPAAASLKNNGALLDRAADKELASYTASGLDPPPRLPS
jgi:hypothetical protein